MSQLTLTSLPDYPTWLMFYGKKKHLPIKKIATLAAKTYGGSISTWRSRFQQIEMNSMSSKLAKHHQDKDARFLEFIGRTADYKAPKKQHAKKTDDSKLIVVSDPHEPYSRKSIWDEILRDHKDASHIHINGDIADFYSKSRFKKTEHEQFGNELRSVFDRLEWLSTHWKKVTLIRGNHDNRTEKAIAGLLDSDMLFLTEMDLLSYMCAWFDNIEVVGERINVEWKNIEISFVWQFQDIIFTHIERSQAQSSALLGTIGQQLHKWSRIFNLKPYRVIIQAHNHRATFDTNGAEYLYLCPMVANVATTGLRYALSPNLNGAPPINGYIIIHHKDGLTDINRTRMRIIE
jgi:predicted phosphodiesterase